MIKKGAKIGLGTKIWHPKLSNIGACRIGRNCVVHSHVWIGDGVKIGNNVKIEAFTFIPEGVIIEDDVFIGPNVTFTNDPHLMIQGRSYWEETLIKSGAKIGAGAIIVAGVIIEKNAIIGAGAVVCKNIPSGEIWAGVPAKRLLAKWPYSH